MFAPHHGIPEDPATGSANVALIGLLAKLRPEPDLRISKTIAQGVEMGRPSLLQAEAEKKNGTVTATYIGGRCVPVMSGTIELRVERQITTLPDRDRRSSRVPRRS